MSSAARSNLTHADLPLLDVYEVRVDAPSSVVLDAVRRRAHKMAAPRWLRRLLAAEPRTGFRIDSETTAGSVLLAGRHRFASYAMQFEAKPSVDGGTALSVRSHARFHGPAGAVYGHVVVGTGAHVLVVRRLLASIARGADPGWTQVPEGPLRR